MTKELSLESLLEMRSQIHYCVSIYSSERERRAASGQNPVLGLAPDMDVVYDYFWPTFERRFSIASLEALLHSSVLQTFILPEVSLEIARHLENLESRLSSPFSRRSSEDYRKLLDESHIRAYLEEDMRWYISLLASGKTFVERLRFFLSHRNVQRKSWEHLPVSPDALEGPEEEILAIYHRLNSYRPYRPLRNYAASRKISVLLGAARSGIFIPLVTNSSSLHALFQSAITTDLPFSRGLLIKPFGALVLISLRNATTEDIDRLRNTALSLLDDIDVCSRDGRLVPVTHEKLNEYFDATCRLAQVSSLLHRTWTPSLAELPPKLNLRELALAALQLSDDLMKELKEFTGLALNNKRMAFTREILKDIVTHNEKVVIQKLIVMERGAELTEYNIHQSGNNLTAIVDSFKTSLGQDKDISTEVNEHLKRLLESIISSNLPDDAKREIVQGTTEVLETVKTNKNLKGKGSLIWNGIREAIKSIPSAVQAWESLSKLWF